MKKILSVLAISTLVFGSATAKKSVSLGYKGESTLWNFSNNGESDDKNLATSSIQEMNFFNLTDIAQGDAISFSATGDVLSFASKIGLSTKGWNANKFKSLKIGANFGAFGLLTGFNADGENVSSFRVTTDSKPGWDGKLFETFKPGSIFKKSYAGFSTNQVNIGGGGAKGIQNRATGLEFQDSELFLQASFNLAIPNSDASFKLLGTVISDRAWVGSSKDASDGTSYTYEQNGKKTTVTTKGTDDDGEFLGASNVKYNDGHLAYTVFAIFSKPSVFNAQAFVKMSPHCLGCNRDQVFVPGAYVEVMAIKNLDIMGGFTMSIVEGTYEDYAFDLRARYAVNSALSFTYMGNVSVLNGDVADTAEISKEVGLYNTVAGESEYIYPNSVAGSGKANANATALKSQAFLWNFLNVRFVLSDTIAANFGVGAITDLVNGINEGPQKGEGTELSIFPNVQFSASKNASLSVGFNVTFRGIGKEEHPVARTSYATYKEDGTYNDGGDTTATQQGLDLGFAIPVLFKVSL